MSEHKMLLNQQTKIELRNLQIQQVKASKFALTWTAQLRKQLFWPGPLRSPLVSVNWCCWFDGDVKKFIGKFRVIIDLFDTAMCGWKFVPTVILSFLSELSRRYRRRAFIDF